MVREKESKLVTVEIIGIKDAQKTIKRNWGSPVDPWYKRKIGKTY